MIKDTFNKNWMIFCVQFASQIKFKMATIIMEILSLNFKVKQLISIQIMTHSKSIQIMDLKIFITDHNIAQKSSNTYISTWHTSNLTNLAPNIQCTRLPMCKTGKCARLVWRGWLDCVLFNFCFTRKLMQKSKAKFWKVNILWHIYIK